MNRILIAAAIVASCVGTATSADAASRMKERTYHHPHHARMIWNAPVAMRPVGPPWAMPNECYTDEGYSRYQVCGAGRH